MDAVIDPEGEAAAKAFVPTEEAGSAGARSSRVALWTLAVLCALVPLANTNLTGFGIGSQPLTYDDIALARLALAAVGVTVAWAAALRHAARTGAPLRTDATSGVLAALAVWAGLSAAFSPHWALGVLGQSERLEGVVTMVCYALLFGVALQVVRGPKDARLLAVGVSVAAIFSGVLAVLQALGVDPMGEGIGGHGFSTKAYAMFGNGNYLAGFLVLVAPVVLALAYTSKGRRAKLGWAAASVLVAVSLIATYTRGALIGAGVEVALVALVLARGRVRVGRTAVWFLAALVVAAVVLTAATFLRDTEQGSVGVRVELIRSAVGAAAERPLLGYGPDAMLPASREHRPVVLARELGSAVTISNVHSWVFQAAATLGWPGAFLLAAALAMGLWKSRGALGAGGGGAGPGSASTIDPLTAAIAVGCVGFVVHMMTSVAVLGATVPFWLLLAVPASAGARTVRAPKAALTAAAVLGATAAVATVVVSGVLLTADHLYMDARVRYHGSDYAGSGADAAAAVRLNPLSVKYRRGLADARVARAFAAITAKAPEAEVRVAYAAADRALADTLALDAEDYPSLAWRAALDAGVGAYTRDPALLVRARRTARQAMALDVDHTEVDALASGATSEQAVASALGVPPAP